MVRAQVQLSEEQLAALREIASKQSVSVSHVVREGLDRLLRERRGASREELVRRSLEGVGLSRSGRGDLATKHDEYFAEAAEQ
jgi:hypothetical protein